MTEISARDCVCLRVLLFLKNGQCVISKIDMPMVAHFYGLL